METMIREGGQTPSRYELLNMVKKHSNFLGKTAVDDQDAAGSEMDQGFWYDVLNLYFILGRGSGGRQDDDLLFFVKKMSYNTSVSDDDGNGNPPYFVRRWASKLDNLLRDVSIEVDWRRSFYLNLIAHTSFSVTVAICSRQVLEKHRAGDDRLLTPAYKVVKTVYASPSRVNFHLDARKEAETFPAYPDICFAVDDFDSTFDTAVLSDRDHCYCVLLNAHGGSAFPSDKSEEDCHSGSSVPVERVPGSIERNKVTIFSGLVNYQLVREAYDAGRSWFDSFIFHSDHSEKTSRLCMKGPGGRGEVEVAVSGVEDQRHQIHGPSSPAVSKKGFGIAMIVHKAASVASVAARQAFAAASASSMGSEEEMLPLKCCLMTISLPWEHIAYDLLFKVSPPVNL